MKSLARLAKVSQSHKFEMHTGKTINTKILIISILNVWYGRYKIAIG